MVLALVDDDTILLERQFRYPKHRHFIEIPAGKLEPGEPALATAQRELVEECGFEAAEWWKITALDPSIGYSNEVIELYGARGLKHVGAKLEAHPRRAALPRAVRVPPGARGAAGARGALEAGTAHHPPAHVRASARREHASGVDDSRRSLALRPPGRQHHAAALEEDLLSRYRVRGGAESRHPLGVPVLRLPRGRFAPHGPERCGGTRGARHRPHPYP